MNIKRNIIFALECRKKDGVPIVENVPIRMRVNFASQRIEVTTGYRIDVAKWDGDKLRVKNGCTNKLKQSASEINAALLGYYTELQEIFKLEYMGQLNFYINVVDDTLRGEHDNKTIGLLLCNGSDKVVAQYALSGYDQPIGVSDYQLSRAIPENLKSALPTVEEVEEELSKIVDKNI